MAAAADSGRTLAELCSGAGVPAPALALTGLALDSRRVGPGTAFVALSGTRAHGLDFLDAALEAGASAVLYPEGDPAWGPERARRCERAGVPAVAVPELARRLGAIAARHFNDPSAALEAVIAVTGTDGKTSVSHFAAAMLDEPGAPAGVLGTLGQGRPGALSEAGLTTPDAIGVQAGLRGLVDSGMRRVALEASSHGLAQFRLDGTRIDVAVLTQLGRDHLDYHGSQEAYAAAKARLFAWPGLRAAVLNAEDPFGRALAERLAADVRAVTYGREHGQLRARDVRAETDGLRFELVVDDTSERVHVPLLGRFNVDNLLAACGALSALDLDAREIIWRLGRIRAVPGRMEAFRARGSATVVVDYAHNAGSLAAVLAALREHVGGRVWCIFGAGGDRDRGKRPLMAAAAAQAADRVIVTDDNPRHEGPDAIVEAIVAGMPADADFTVERDRDRALALALERATADDAILLAGKGHETGQVRGERTIPWSDRAAARRHLGLDREGAP